MYTRIITTVCSGSMRYSIFNRRKADLCVVTTLFLKSLSSPSCRAFSLNSIYKHNTLQQFSIKRIKVKLKAGRERRLSTSKTNEGGADDTSSNVIHPP